MTQYTDGGAAAEWWDDDDDDYVVDVDVVGDNHGDGDEQHRVCSGNCGENAIALCIG